MMRHRGTNYSSLAIWLLNIHQPDSGMQLFIYLYIFTNCTTEHVYIKVHRHRADKARSLWTKWHFLSGLTLDCNHDTEVFSTGQMCVDLVCTRTAVQAGRLCQGATSVLCVSNAPDVTHSKLSLTWSVGQKHRSACLIDVVDRLW